MEAENNGVMSAQEVFNKAVGGVIKQGRKSMSSKAYGDRGSFDFYAYRSSEGLRCTVGHLLDDDEYTPDIEKRSVNNIALRKEEFIDKMPKFIALLLEHEELIKRLQGAHDGSMGLSDEEFIRDFKHEAEKIAKEFDLEWKF